MKKRVRLSDTLPSTYEIRSRRTFLAFVGDRLRRPFAVEQVKPAARLPDDKRAPNGWLPKPFVKGSFDILVSQVSHPQMFEPVVWDRFVVEGREIVLWRGDGEGHYRGRFVFPERDSMLRFNLGGFVAAAREWSVTLAGQVIRPTPAEPERDSYTIVLPEGGAWTYTRMLELVREAWKLDATWVDDEGRPVAVTEPEKISKYNGIYVWPPRRLTSPEYGKLDLSRGPSGELLCGVHCNNEALEKLLRRHLLTQPGVRIRTGNCLLTLAEWQHFRRTGELVRGIGEARVEQAERPSNVIRLAR